MSLNPPATSVQERPTAAHRIAQAVRQGAHAAHEAQLFRSMARDAVESRIHAARLGVKRGARRVEDLTDDAITFVRRRPIQSVGAGFGVGLGIGLVVAFFARRLPRSEC
jgi:ElaB/YqjD/DUF883 family membrane-anchored ribosome-binding protein